MSEFYTAFNREIFILLNGLLNLYSDSFYIRIFWRMVTLLGDGYFLMPVLLSVMPLNKTLYTKAFTAYAAVNIFVQGLKNGLDFRRPFGVLSPEEFFHYGAEYASRSFPSGHTANAFFAAMVIALAYKFEPQKTFVLFILAGLAGLSRIAMGQHWPTDVLVSAVLTVILSAVVFKQTIPQKAETVLFYLTYGMMMLTALYVLVAHKTAPQETVPELYIKYTVAATVLLIGGYRMAIYQKLFIRRTKK